MKSPANVDSNLSHLFRQHLLGSTSPIALVQGMAAAELVAAKTEAEQFRAKADAWIRAHPNRARELANKVEAMKRTGGTVEMGDVIL